MDSWIEMHAYYVVVVVVVPVHTFSLLLHAFNRAMAHLYHDSREHELELGS